MAGLPISQGTGDSSAATDWLFSQGEVVIREGTVRWNDEMRGAPELSLQKVDVVLRNGNWRHSLRVDATPLRPGATASRWWACSARRCCGCVTAIEAALERAAVCPFLRVDVSRLRHHADVGIDAARGRGALRAWADVQRGQIVGGTADPALADVHATRARGCRRCSCPPSRPPGAPPQGL